MYEALSLFSDLDDADIEWIFQNAVEQQVIANTALTREGEPPDALYVVLEGLAGVKVRALGPDVLRTLGPGEIVGDMSFLEGLPASATVEAVENSLLLAIPKEVLDRKVRDDPLFASRLYRAFARSLSRRLRLMTGALPRLVSSRAKVDAVTQSRWDEIDTRLSDFKRILADADREAIRNGDVVPEDMAQDIRARFNSFCIWLNDQIGDRSPDAPEVRQELGARVQREVLPYLILTKNGERWYSKPRGYAGDFLSIDWIYRNEAEGAGRLGPVLDRCFLDVHAAQAVRNRRPLLVEEIRRTIAERGSEPVNLLSMACGPAREIFDTLETMSDPSKLAATCVDIDLQALAYVGDARDRSKFKRNIRLENSNLVYLATGRRTLDLPPQDLAYSIGLIDYFNDGFVVKLLDYVHELLRPGGRVILGNFHPSNPTKVLQDHVLDWKLIHREEADMNRLFEASRFGRRCEEIRYEAQGVNLFAIGRRQR
jgi:CRP-like cAMP-binding protein/SAM-dependent methyltransferase